MRKSRKRSHLSGSPLRGEIDRAGDTCSRVFSRFRKVFPKAPMIGVITVACLNNRSQTSLPWRCFLSRRVRHPLYNLWQLTQTHTHTHENDTKCNKVKWRNFQRSNLMEFDFFKLDLSSGRLYSSLRRSASEIYHRGGKNTKKITINRVSRIPNDDSTSLFGYSLETRGNSKDQT